jgi:hypothetical protein
LQKGKEAREKYLANKSGGKKTSQSVNKDKIIKKLKKQLAEAQKKGSSDNESQFKEIEDEEEEEKLKKRVSRLKRKTKMVKRKSGSEADTNGLDFL